MRQHLNSSEAEISSCINIDIYVWEVPGGEIRKRKRAYFKISTRELTSVRHVTVSDTAGWTTGQAEEVRQTWVCKSTACTHVMSDFPGVALLMLCCFVWCCLSYTWCPAMYHTESLWCLFYTHWYGLFSNQTPNLFFKDTLQEVGHGSQT